MASVVRSNLKPIVQPPDLGIRFRPHMYDDSGRGCQICGLRRAWINGWSLPCSDHPIIEAAIEATMEESSNA